MIKLVYCLRRLPTLSREEFQRYWRENHAPLVKKHSETLRIRRYVQVHTTDSQVTEVVRASRPGPEPYDGVAELWYVSAEEMIAGATTPEGRQASRELLEDEKRFINISQSPIWIATENPVVE